MTSIRGTNSSIQVSTQNLNKTINLTANSTTSYHNMTVEELNITLGDPSIISDVESYTSIVIPIILIAFSIITIAIVINFKTTINKIKNMYKEYTTMQFLPTYHRQKAKESPFISSQSTQQLPPHHRLNGAEKGQNMQFKVSIPYRRLHSSENLASNEEHRITITTVFQKTPTILNS